MLTEGLQITKERRPRRPPLRRNGLAEDSVGMLVATKSVGLAIVAFDGRHLDVGDFEMSGWFKVGAQSYRHHCGARVAKRGRQWTATSITGSTFACHSTVLQAMAYLEEHDPAFWSYGDSAIEGANGNICCKLGFQDAAHMERKEGLFVCHLYGRTTFPVFLRPVFKK
jgi:hypothetical protein